MMRDADASLEMTIDSCIVLVTGPYADATDSPGTVGAGDRLLLADTAGTAGDQGVRPGR